MANPWDNDPIVSESPFKTVTIGKRDPAKARDDERKDEDQAMERERIRLAREAADRAAADQVRQTTKDAQGQEYQAKSSSFYGRMMQSQNDWNAAKGDNLGPRGVLRQGLHDKLPNAENAWNDATRQVTDQAARNFIAAQLRLESGAAISPQEYDNQYRIFFPMPNDGPEVIAQKARARLQATQSMRLSAGPLADQVDATIQPSVAPAAAGETVNYSQELPGGLTGSVTDDSPAQAQEPAAPTATQNLGEWGESPLAQGAWGFNEGLASTLGAPVDLSALAMKYGAKGINALAGTDIPTNFDQAPIGGGQWFKDNVFAPTIGDESADPTNQFVRRMGQSVGAAAVPVGATARTAGAAGGQMLASLAGGAGAATAQQVAPGNIGAEMLGEMAGGGITGLGMAGLAQRGAQRGIEAAIPTVDQLKSQAGELYRQAEARGVTADPMVTQQLADDFHKTLQAEGLVSPTGRLSEVYPKAREAKQLIDDYAGSTMNPTQMQTVRKMVADGMTSPDATERRMGSMLTDVFDDWSAPLAPELPQARDISSRYLNAQKLEQARELAGARSSQFSGSGFENALRTEYRGLDRNAIKGKGRYSDVLRDAIETVNRGTTASNAAREVGKLAPTGVVSLGLGSGIPAAVGGLLAGPAGAAAAGGGAMGLGLIGREAATRMGLRNAQLAELTARNGGAIPQAQMLTPEVAKAVAALVAAQQAQYLNKNNGQ